MELRDYVRTLKTRAWLIIAITFVTLGAAIAFSLLETPLYEAEANLLISESNSGSAAIDAALAGFSVQPERGLQTQVRMLEMRPAFERTIRRLDLRMHPDQLQARTDVGGEGQTNVISIHVRDEDPKRAARIANVLAEEYSLWVRDFSRARIRAAADQVEEQLEEVRAQLVEMGSQSGTTMSNRDRVALQIAGEDYAGLSEQLRQLRIREEMEVGPVQVVNTAAVPEEPISPKPVRNGMIALALGLVFGLGAAFGIELLDTTVKHAEEVAALTSTPVLGVVPMQKADAGAAIVLDETASNPVAEAIRGVRHSLDFINFDGRIKTLLVTSAAPGEGKSTLATNLAVGLARTGRTVALVSVDFHRPKSAAYLGLSETLGLSHVLTGQYGLETCLQSGEEGLLVLASGKVPPNPSELLSSERMGDLVAELEGRVDWVILDGPPVLAVADTTAVTKWADGTMIVVRAGKTHRDALERAVGMLNGVGAKLVGSVLVGVPETGSGTGAYGYSSYAYKRRGA